tara:strand:- start:54 stop:545 length:492 start_codon:yes stop_codon:yes gene_type:complete
MLFVRIFKKNKVDLMQTLKIINKKNIALVAHDNKKNELLNWIIKNQKDLINHSFYATGTTGRLISKQTDLKVICLQSGPLGGDQQIGAKISEKKIDMLFFFWDPLQAQPHDPDVKALIRLAAVWNIPVACNLSTADFMISSPFFKEGYDRCIPDYSEHNKREI